MIPKQDRQGVRTAAGLEQKYNIGGNMSDQERAMKAQAEQITRQEQNFNDFQSSSTARMVDLENELETTDKDITNLERRASRLESRASAAEKNISNLQKQVSSSASNSETRFNAAEENLSSLQKTVQELVKELETVVETLGKLEKRVTALESA